MGISAGGGAFPAGDNPLGNWELEAIVRAIVYHVAPVVKACAEGSEEDSDMEDAEYTLSDAGGDAWAEDSLYQCHSCGNGILSPTDVLSADYRVMTGPAFLASCVCNVCVSDDLQEAVYSSGRYTVRDIACNRCATRLGITYAGATSTANRYKVGKFLVAQDQLISPPGPGSTDVPADEASFFTELMELARHGSGRPPTPRICTSSSGEALSRIDSSGAASVGSVDLADTAHNTPRELASAGSLVPVAPTAAVAAAAVAAAATVEVDGRSRSADLKTSTPACPWAVPARSGASLDLSRCSFAGWLEDVDGGLGNLSVYLSALNEHFDTPAQVVKLYAKLDDAGRPTLSPQFFEDCSVQKLGHRRLFQEWFAGLPRDGPR